MYKKFIVCVLGYIYDIQKHHTTHPNSNMEKSYEYLNTIAKNDTTIFGSVYRVSMCINRSFMRKSSIDNTDEVIYCSSCIYSMSSIVVLLTYLIYGNDTFEDYIDDIEFLVFHIGMFLSNIIVYFVKDDEKYSFIYLSLFKVLGYLSQYYLMYVVDITKYLYDSFFFDVLGKIVKIIDNKYNYIFEDEDNATNFWIYGFIAVISVVFIIYFITKNPLIYSFVIMFPIILMMVMSCIAFVMLVVPISYVICLTICMYGWGLLFLFDYVLFIRELDTQSRIIYNTFYQEQSNV